jgi:hypothetical protein
MQRAQNLIVFDLSHRDEVLCFSTVICNFNRKVVKSKVDKIMK